MPIVPLEEAHADGFRALVAATLPEFGFELDPAFDSDLDDPAAAYAAVWVALNDEQEVVGSVALRDLGDGAVELKRMYLRPSERGRGLGKQLLATALDWARAHGKQAVRLDTSERMVAARGLYEANGFRLVEGSAPRQGQCRLLYQLRL
jgi:GNAT superfamily N-acetyltransferase